VRFEPGDSKTVELVEIAGNRVIAGGNNVASGPVDPTRADTIVQALQMRGTCVRLCAASMGESKPSRGRIHGGLCHLCGISVNLCVCVSHECLPLLCVSVSLSARLPSRGEQRGRGQAGTCGGRGQQQ
jgi:hypothetical protein